MSEELKPCPFCGGEASWSIGNRLNYKPIELHYIECLYCAGCSEMLENKEDAIIAWNKRSDGYHTFDELYEHRNLLFINYCLERIGASWIKISEDYPGYFCLYTGTPHGQVSYHIPNKYRYLVEGVIPERPREWDGHTSDDVLQRLLKRAEDCH